MNNICLIGNICADPELRTTEAGNAVATFRIGVRRPRTKENVTDFFNIVAWRHNAEFVCKYGKKGSQIAVSGILCNRDYTNQNGEKRYITEIVADHVQLVGGRREQGTPSGEPGQAVPATNDSYTPAYSSDQTGNAAPAFEEIKGDDPLPF